MRKEDSFITFSVSLGKENLRGSNKPLEKAFKRKMSKLDQEKKKAAGEQDGKEKAGRSGASCPRIRCLHKRACYESPISRCKRSCKSIYKNSIFLDNIKEFQTDLLLKESKPIQYAIQTMDYEKMILNINY